MLQVSIVDLSLHQNQVLQYYKGMSQNVRVYDRAGQYMVLPIGIFMDYVNYEGIYGTFEITYKLTKTEEGETASAKFVNVKKID